MSNKVIKGELTAPYDEKQRIDFIVEYNHNQGCIIEDLEDKLQAYVMELTEEEIQEQQKQERNKEIEEKIKELQIMALPEILNGNTENIKLYNEVIDGLNNAKF